jgi:cytochrome c oxidase subunit 3
MRETLPLQERLPVGGPVRTSPGWWGLWALIVTEGSLFGYLLMTYFYLCFQKTTPWPPDGWPRLLMPGLNTGILLSSSVCVWLAETWLKKARKKTSLMALATAILLGILFVLIQWNEWHNKPYGLASHLYGSLFFTITGVHMLHVMVGILMLSVLWLWTAMGYLRPGHLAPLTLGGLYWHFVDAVWLCVFASFYLSPFVLGR